MIDTDLQQLGLSEAEVLRQRAAGQGNTARLKTSRSYVQILRENLLTFINAVFFTIGVLLLALGRYGDAVLVLVVILGGVVVSVVQEIWAKRKLDRIALLTQPRATVIREGKDRSIDPREIVIGDLLMLQVGDPVVVDGRMVSGRVDIDESLLTGESDAIAKTDGDSVYSGSFCTSGQGYYVAEKVGSDSLAYQLTVKARAFRQKCTPLQQEINLVIRIFMLLATFLWILEGISTVARVISLDEGVQRAAVIAGLVPSGLYLSITLAYAVGAVRMVGRRVLLQQANAVESLSHVDVLCLDKTGTLTANCLALETLYPVGMSEAQLRECLGTVVASFSDTNATSDAIRQGCPGTRQAVRAEIPFSSARKWSAIELDSGVYVLGAPEILTTEISKTAMSIDPALVDRIHQETQRGRRVLLFARSSQSLAEAVGSTIAPQNLALPPGLQPLGVLSFRDELRDRARETLKSFADAGIALKIISGDNPDTVAALARQVGIDSNLKAISGLTLAQMDAKSIDRIAAERTIFGRVTPEQKAQLVESLRRQGHYVAAIGDGVNDVLSLKQANLGIAMESGSKATRSVADMVLLNDSFESLPQTFLEGQRVRNGIQDVLKVFAVRMLAVTAIILATGQVIGTFPMLNKHSAIVTIVGVGLPTFGFPLWAKPGFPPKGGAIRSLLHFTLPATVTMTLVSLMVYLGYLVTEIWEATAEGTVAIDDGFLAIPRSALVTVMVTCELLLVPFLKPPTKAWVGGEKLSGDWRYSIVALVLLVGYYVGLMFAPVREFFELSLLDRGDYVLIIWLSLLWALVLRYTWRAKLFDRFLGVDLQP
ncbi:MAG: HAD-IC family P-type ATPase [Cyanobacteria bacterium SID2]|nr:HAD-IC family P-type ATPase [Cyanobacteria bacterium SID2]MBP0006021.1 HAD-IC family P-type ATPase [Cyanobacteria bacterium SBC]